jgi:hypothetical protein
MPLASQFLLVQKVQFCLAFIHQELQIASITIFYHLPHLLRTRLQLLCSQFSVTAYQIFQPSSLADMHASEQ